MSEESNKFGTGKPISQEFIAEGLKARESKLNSEAKSFQDFLIKSNSENQKFLLTFIETLKKGGMDIDNIISAAEQRKKELLGRIK